MKELYGSSVCSKWEDIGLLLGIESGTLDIIKSEQRENSKDCLREMLKVWNKGIDPPPTWSAIIEAVEKVEDIDIASKLKSKYLHCE